MIPLRQPDTAAAHPPLLAIGQGAGAAGGRPADLGLAGDRRISGGGASRPCGRPTGRHGRWRGRSAARCTAALPPCAPSCPWTSPPASIRRASCWRRSRATSTGSSRIWADCRRLAGSRAVPVRPVHHRRRDVRAGLLALRHLCRAADRAGAGLCRADDGPAGDAGMGSARPCRADAAESRCRRACRPEPDRATPADPSGSRRHRRRCQPGAGTGVGRAGAPEPEPAPEPAPVRPAQAEPPPVAVAPPPPVASPTAPGEPPAELRRGPRPIPSTIMVKPIGDGTRRRR